MYIPNLVETGDVLNTEQNGFSGELIVGKPHQGYEQRGLARNHQKSILPVAIRSDAFVIERNAELLRSKFPQRNGVAETDQLNQLQVGQIAGRAVHQGPDQGARLRDTSADEDAHPGFAFLDNLLRGDNFIRP